MADIEIKRGYEVLPDNNVRFGIRVINNSDFAILDVEVILDYSESLFDLEGSKVQKLDTIPPTVPRTAKFTLKPLGCIHKEEIAATIRYKDHQWKRHTLEMQPKEVHCVCPFLKEKSITRDQFLTLLDSGYLEERGINFEGIAVDKVVDFLHHTCKNRLYRVDEIPIENGTILYLAGDALGEEAYYLLTAVVEEYDSVTQVLLRANSGKSHGLNGFLNEILDNLRYLVLSADAREIGIIKKEQVINIIDSVVQKTTFAGGEGAASVNIEGSVVQRAEIGGDETEKKSREGDAKRKREEQEKLRREEEERKAKEAAEQREKEKTSREEERLRREQEEQLRRRDIWDNSKEIITIKTIQYKGRFLGLGKRKTEIENRVETRRNFIGMKFTLIHAGEFEMGCLLDVGEKPEHNVKIDKPFYLGAYPVTQREWEVVMRTNPSEFKGDDLPVAQVLWNDVQEFIRKLNEMEGKDKYRLPSEAEWEYACQAGAITIYSFGYSESDLGDYAWYAENSGSRPPKKGDYFGYDKRDLFSLKWNGKPHPVGLKLPNPWGLYDMHGNVHEWVQDRYHSNYDGAPVDGSAWESGDGDKRVSRGGDWISNAMACRSAFRFIYGYRSLGFRLLKEL